MNSKIFLIVAICLLSLPQLVCEKNLTESTESERVYVVKTIQNVSVEEFAVNPLACDWPLVIKLENYKPNGTYEGSVKLANLGWLKIDRNCTEKNCFTIDTGDKLGPVEYIVIKKFNISDTNMTGWFGCAGSTIDTPALTFTAVREK